MANMIEMKTDDIISLLYDGALFFDQQRTNAEIEYETFRAKKVNQLLGKTVFSDEYIEKLNESTMYSSLESCYQFIMNTMMERSKTLESIKKELFIIITNGINFRTDLIDNASIIVFEFPLVKYINLMNIHVLGSSDFNDFKSNCFKVTKSFVERIKYINDYNAFTSLYSLNDFDSVKYQQIMLFEQLQTVFMIGHELGHVLNPTLSGLDSELTSDLIGLNIVKDYVLNKEKMNVYIIISIMLLFSYLALLDVVQATNKQNKITARENWLDRYESVLTNLEELELQEQEISLINGYDKICNVLDEIMIEIIDNN